MHQKQAGWTLLAFTIGPATCAFLPVLLKKPVVLIFGGHASHMNYYVLVRNNFDKFSPLFSVKVHCWRQRFLWLLTCTVCETECGSVTSVCPWPFNLWRLTKQLRIVVEISWKL
jgi:hypothetical protein